MKKYFTAIILIVLCFAAAAPAQAAFWSKWFKKKTTPVENIAKPAPPIVDAADVERRAGIAMQIAAGAYKGPADVSITFTEAEAREYLLPLANKNFKKMKSPVGAELTGIFLSDGAVEVLGQIIKPLNASAAIRIIPRVENGAVKADISRVKLGWFTLPKAAVNKLLASNGVDLKKQSWKIPHFTFSEITIKDGRITFAGIYKK